MDPTQTGLFDRIRRPQIFLVLMFSAGVFGMFQNMTPTHGKLADEISEYTEQGYYVPANKFKAPELKSKTASIKGSRTSDLDASPSP